MNPRQPDPPSDSEYAEFLAARDEILRHKWIESEKAGHDVGFEQALVDWVRNHREAWRLRRKTPPRQPSA